MKRPTLCLIAAMLLFAGCGSEPKSPEAPAAQAIPAPKPGEVGGPLPVFRLKDVNGREVSSEDFKGKVLLVDYWATWCKPCETEMPEFQELQDAYGEQGFAVVGIAMDTNPKDVAVFARKHRIRYPLLMGTPESQQSFSILGIPTSMVVDRQGIIRKKVIGFEYKDAFEAALKPLL